MRQAASLPDTFLDKVRQYPDKTFILFHNKPYSYNNIYTEVSKAAGTLRNWGLGKGERVALYLENSPSFIISYLAVLWLGAVVVPVNTRYRQQELWHMLTDSAARLVITDAAGVLQLQGVIAQCPAVEAILELSGQADLDTARWQELAATTELPQPVRLQANDLAVIAYTSGTTGRSKGAMLSHGNFLSNSQAVTTAWQWTPQDHLLLVLPLFHIHGLGVGLHGTIIQGSSLTLGQSFDAPDVISKLRSSQITLFFGVPTMYSRLLDVARQFDAPFGRLRLLVCGSAPLNPQLHTDLEQVFGVQVLERYGMTETVMNLGNPLGAGKAGSVGLPFAGVEMRIAGPENEVRATGEHGEIQLRGPNICLGYWQRPEATAESWTADGWFKTGDLGYQDQNGYTYISGRAKELIISGGFNIYPREVEEVLESHPHVQEAAVIGLPDEDLGEKVVAVIVAGNPELDIQSLQDFCKAHIASFKKPRDIIMSKELPRNALGKVQKQRLKDDLIAARATA